MRCTGSPAMRRLNAASIAAIAPASTPHSGSAMACVRVVPEKCSTISLASSAGSATAAAARRARAAFSSGPSLSGRLSAIEADIGEQLRLVIGDQRVDDLVEFAHHHPVELVERQIDAMVGDAALREVISADPLRAVARTDLRFARFGA